MAERHSFGVNPITCHAWNRDRTRKWYQGLACALILYFEKKNVGVPL